MLVTIDIPAESQQSFRILCREYALEIRSFDEHGPAGGNPRYQVLVPDQ